MREKRGEPTRRKGEPLSAWPGFQPIAMCQASCRKQPAIGCPALPQDSTFGFLVLGHNVTGGGDLCLQKSEGLLESYAGGAIISRAQRPADAESARLVL